MVNIPMQFSWKYITDNSVRNVTEQAYLISENGDIYSNLRNTLLQPTETWNGYLRVCLRLKNGTSRYYLIHRIVMIEFNPVKNYDVLEVNHSDGNKHNNHISNLEWSTSSENIIHAYKNGLKFQYHGEDCPWATINNTQAEEIAKMIISDEKYTYAQIASIVGCSPEVVGDIARGPNWPEVRAKYNLDNYNRHPVHPLSDEQIHEICKFFEMNDVSNYKNLSDMFRFIAINILHIEPTKGFMATALRLYKKQTRLDIVNMYNY